MKDRLLFITQDHLLKMELNLPSHILGSIYLGFKNENFIASGSIYIEEHAEQLFASLGWRFETIEIYTRTETILRLVTAGAGVGFIFESYLSYFNEERKPACFSDRKSSDYGGLYGLLSGKNETISGFHPFLDMILCIIKVMRV